MFLSYLQIQESLSGSINKAKISLLNFRRVINKLQRRSHFWVCMFGHFHFGTCGCEDWNARKILLKMEFSPTRPHWAELVSKSPCPCVCLSVCLCHRETPTSGGRADLWSKIAFLILVWDDTFSKKKGGPIFWRNLLGGVEIFFTRDFGGGSKIARKKISPKNWTPRFFENCVIPDQY